MNHCLFQGNRHISVCIFDILNPSIHKSNAQHRGPVTGSLIPCFNQIRWYSFHFVFEEHAYLITGTQYVYFLLLLQWYILSLWARNSKKAEYRNIVSMSS